MSSRGTPVDTGHGSTPLPTSSKHRKAAEKAIKAAAEKAAAEKAAAEAARLAELRRQYDLRQLQLQKSQTPVRKSHVPYDLGWMYKEGPYAPTFVYVPNKDDNGHGGTRRTKSKSKSKSKSKRSKSRSRSRAHRSK